MTPNTVHSPTTLPGWSLPPLVRTRGGVTFDPRPDLWAYRDSVYNVRLNFARLPQISEPMRQAAKHVLIWYAENCAPKFLRIVFTQFQELICYLAQHRTRLIKEIDNVDLINYRTHIGAQTHRYFSSLGRFLVRWNDMGLRGVSADARAFVKALRLPTHERGVAVATMDPEKGPFTDIELGQIHSALNTAFAKGMISDDIYLLTWLFMALGQRPSQYAALKVRDVKAVTVESVTHYAVHVPRVKQATADPRVQLKERPLNAPLGKRLYAYAQAVRARFSKLLCDPDDAPLFPQAQRLTGALGEWPAGYAYHQTASMLSGTVINALTQLHVHSERSGLLLRITPVRFRRTFGTRAAQEGHGELVIAELLDHSSTAHVGVYVAAIPEIAARIDRAMALQMAPLAQAFKGMLIDTESDATRGDDPTSRIIDARIDRSMRPMGSCGQFGFCDLAAPIACYTCHQFQPWIDGPHEAVLEHLLTKREQLLAMTDPRLAATNDTAILAVAQVIRLCREARPACET